jgi:hypothetical protein
MDQAGIWNARPKNRHLIEAGIGFDFLAIVSYLPGGSPKRICQPSAPLIVTLARG